MEVPDTAESTNSPRLAGTVNWGTATVIGVFAGMLYGGSKEAAASVRLCFAPSHALACIVTRALICRHSHPLLLSLVPSHAVTRDLSCCRPPSHRQRCLCLLHLTILLVVYV
ncbi:hypothetical protein V8G54_016313 [Vigna mungo]|uniref:Uncharacterized protein n=1 Tax=Vigna mungo TaxID=3915 RepID=A0AAQ3NNR1_VIGMU